MDLRGLFVVLSITAAQSADPCSVTSFGAKCDAVTDDTSAVQAAIDACAYSIVSFPSGKTCLTFPLSFHNGTSVHLPAGATLKAFPDVSRWPGGHDSFVELKHHQDVAVFGEGTIDGSGEQWWTTEADGNMRPRLFHMSSFHNVSFRGVTIRNTGAMAMVWYPPCSAATIDGVTILNPAVGNTDGIDMACDGALIQNTRVVGGDDSICMKSGAKNVLVRNCTVENGAPYPGALAKGLAGGLVLGTSDDVNMTNVTFTDCTVTGALAGVRIKFRPTQHGKVHDVLFDDIRIVRPVVFAVDVYMESDHLLQTPLEASLRTVELGDVTLRNIRGELGSVPAVDCKKGPCPRAAARFHCTADFPCSGFHLEHFNVTGFEPSSQYKVPCEWTNSWGSASDVRPAACTPPVRMPVRHIEEVVV